MPAFEALVEAYLTDPRTIAVRAAIDDLEGPMEDEELCPMCYGVGVIETLLFNGNPVVDMCTTCDGTGLVQTVEEQ